MKGTTYFAIFEPNGKGGFGVYFPDLLGCISVGENLEEAKKMAEEALGLHLWGMEKDNEEIPEATMPPFDDVEEGCFVMPITVYMSVVKNEMENSKISDVAVAGFVIISEKHRTKSLHFENRRV